MVVFETTVGSYTQSVNNGRVWNNCRILHTNWK